MRITRGYKRDDIPRLLSINDSCFKGLERPPHDVFNQMLKTSEVWLAKTEDDIIGFIIVNRIGLTMSSYLWSVAVDPSYQRQGVAGKLIREAESWCQSVGDREMRLHCHSDNPSQKLYFDRGYRVYDLAREYYGPETVALMMRKSL